MKIVNLKHMNPEEVLKRKWTQPKPLNPIINHNTLCEFCSGLVGGRNSDCTLMCIYCNVVVHKNCLLRVERSFSSNGNAIHKINSKSWVCFYCIEYLDDSKMMFDREQNTAKNYQIMVGAQIIIAKYWRRRMERRRFLKIYKVVLKLQMWFQLRKKRRLYLQRKLEKLRVIKITIEYAENVLVCGDKTLANSSKAEKAASNSYYVVIAVVDKTRGLCTQSWHDVSAITSFSANSKLTQYPTVPFHSQHVLPGVSALQTITMSVIQKGKRDFFLGQVSLHLQDDNIWMKGGTLQKELEEVQFLVKDKSGQDMKFNYSPAPQGQLKFRLQVFLGMKSECGNVLGSHIEDFTRSLNKLPATSAFLHHNCMVAERFVSKAASNSSLDTTSSAPAGSATSQDIKLPLVQAHDAASVAAQGSKKKLWIAIVEGYLFVYQCYGGQFRLTLSISQFDYSIQPCHQGAVFSLHKFGYPSFHFQTLEKTDFFRWKCALICNIRYLVDPQAEFNTEQLIQDIVKINAVYMPAKTPHHTQRSNEHVKDATVGSKDRGSKPRVSKSLHSLKDFDDLSADDSTIAGNKSPFSSALSSTNRKAADFADDFEDSIVDLRHSVKHRNRKGKGTGMLLAVKKSKMLTSVLAVAVLDDEVRNVNISQELDNNESVNAADVRESLSALDVLDEDATDENLCNNSFTAAAELFTGMLFAKDIDIKIKV